MTKRKVFMVLLIGLLVLGVSSDGYAKKKKKMTKEEKKAAKLAKQVGKITNILGTGTSWKPTAFTNIRKGMTCQEVKQHFPKVSCGDFTPTAMAGFKGSASEYKFHFLSGRLYAATIVFRPRLFDEKRFTTALYTVAQEKWGKLPENRLQQPKWGNPDFDDIEMKYNKTHWEVKVDLPSYDPGETASASLDEAQIRTELAALMGPKRNYLPTIISQLSGGMTCEQVKALYPDLYECKPGSSSNFPKASVEGHPMVAGLSFSFRNDRLTYVTLIFHYQISRDILKNAAFIQLQENWGDQARVFPDKELVTVYPKPKGSLTLKYNGNRWEYKVGMEGRKGSVAPVAVSSVPQKSINGLWTLEAARQGKKIDSMKGGTLRQLEFSGGKLFMKENGKVVMENFYSRSGNNIYFTAAKDGKAVKQFGSVVSHEGNKLILRFAGKAIDMIFIKK